ncbi:ABC-type uncharacterized transport system, permease component [Serratia liquefaciens]|nr:ABC-type uncharacterized transport system, permease component [Serratia liquefaciens]
MNGHNITNESLALSMVLVLIAILVSYREKLALEKDIIWSICRAIVQLIIVGYVLKYIFNVNHAVLTLLMVLFICFNARRMRRSAVNISTKLLSRRLSPSLLALD